MPLLKKLFGGGKPPDQSPEERLADLIAHRLSDPIDRKTWDHACSVCGWPWKPTWHRRPDSEMLWSSCGACLAIAVDVRGRGAGGDSAFVTFLVVEREIAEWVISQIATWPAWAGDLLDAGLPDFGGYLPAQDWDQRCPACLAAWRDAWWDESLASCQVCHYASAYRFLRREPVWLDLVPFVGFQVDEPEDDDALYVAEMDAADWHDLCPACDSPMTNPWVGDTTDDDGTILSVCPDCNLYTTFEDGERLTAWTTLVGQVG